MRYLLLILIKCYWIIIPAGKRRTCLFKKSCSHYVFDMAYKYGFLTGLKALNYRFKNCRHGAVVYINPCTGKTAMILPNKDIINEEDIAEKLLTNLQ